MMVTVTVKVNRDNVIKIACVCVSLTHETAQRLEVSAKDNNAEGIVARAFCFSSSCGGQSWGLPAVCW